MDNTDFGDGDPIITAKLSDLKKSWYEKQDLKVEHFVSKESLKDIDQRGSEEWMKNAIEAPCSFDGTMELLNDSDQLDIVGEDSDIDSIEL